MASSPRRCVGMQASLFHLRTAALQGVPYALLAMAKMYAGLEPGLAPFAAVGKAAERAGLVWREPVVADRLFELAAERGVRGAAVALATAAAAGTHVGGAAREAPAPDGVAAALWFARAVDMKHGDPVRWPRPSSRSLSGVSAREVAHGACIWVCHWGVAAMCL